LIIWLRDYAAHQVNPKTLEHYQGIIRDHINPAIGRHQLTKLRPLHIQDLYSKALESRRLDGRGGLAPRTVLHMHRVLHKALDQAMKWQIYHTCKIQLSLALNSVGVAEG